LQALERKAKINKTFFMVYQVEYITSLHVYKHTPLKLILINVNFHIEINISEHFAENTEGWQSYKIIKVC